MADDVEVARMPSEAYAAFVTVDSGTPLIDLFPDGIEFIARGDNIVLLTEARQPPEPKVKEDK